MIFLLLFFSMTAGTDSGQPYPNIKADGEALPTTYWSDYATKPTQGEGTFLSPYRINSAEELAYFSGKEFTYVCIQLENDIDLSEHLWKPINPTYSLGLTRTICIKGGYHTISGLKVSEVGYAALVGCTGNGDSKFENLHIDNGDITANKAADVTKAYAAGFVAYGASISGFFKNCSFSGKVKADATTSRAGCLMGYSSTKSNFTVENCINYGNIVGKEIGGLFGYMSPGSSYQVNFSNCLNYGDITGQIYVGGIAGNLNNADMSGCKNFGKVSSIDYSSNYVRVGGLVGYASKSSSGDKFNIENCVNEGIVYEKNTGSYSYIGGIVGSSGSYNINNCLNYGTINTIKCRYASIGGLVGSSADTTFVGNQNYGIFDFQESFVSPTIGGIVGTVGGISKLENNRNYTSLLVNGKGIRMGGIVGDAEADNCMISDCINLARIEAISSTDAHLGGIIGELKGGTTSSTGSSEVLNCVNYADITSNAATENDVAGIIGRCNQQKTVKVSIKNSQNYGNITNSSEASESANVAGLVGRFTSYYDATINYCGNFGNIKNLKTSSANTAGLVARVETTTTVKPSPLGFYNSISMCTIEAPSGSVAGVIAYVKTSSSLSVRIESCFIASTIIAGSNNPAPFSSYSSYILDSGFVGKFYLASQKDLTYTCGYSSYLHVQLFINEEMYKEQKSYREITLGHKFSSDYWFIAGGDGIYKYPLPRQFFWLGTVTEDKDILQYFEEENFTFVAN